MFHLIIADAAHNALHECSHNGRYNKVLSTGRTWLQLSISVGLIYTTKIHTFVCPPNNIS